MVNKLLITILLVLISAPVSAFMVLRGSTSAEPPAGIERVGTVVTINSATASSSQSITVPSDAEIAVAFASAWGDGPSIPASVLTLGGSAMTDLVNSGGAAANNQAKIEYKTSPTTGSVTLAWNFSTWGPSSGRAGFFITVVFYKGIDTSSPFRDSDGVQGATSITGLTYSTGDMMIGGVANDGVAATVTASSQTQLASAGPDAVTSVFYFAAGEKSSTGTFDYTGDSYPGAVACILKPAP